MELCFNEDNTCTVDEKEYTWQIKWADGIQGCVEVLSESKTVYEFPYTLYNNGDCAVLYDSDSSRGVYINPAHYDIIEITADNWLDYFELNRCFSRVEDPFGKASSLRERSYNLSLKEEYSKRLSSIPSDSDRLTKDAIEFSFSFGWLNCTIDLEKRLAR